MECNDHQRIWAVLDKVRTKHPDMVLLHGAAAGRWADPAAGESGDLLDLIGANQGLDRLHDILAEARAFLIACPGSGIVANLADKARHLGILVWRFGDGDA